MKKGLIGLLSLLLVAVLTGCGGTATETESTTEETSEEMAAPASEGSGSAKPMAEESSEAAEPAEAAEEAVEAVVETAAEATDDAETPAEMKTEEAAPTVDGLVGTKWTYDEINLEFREGNKVFLKGGPLAALAPDGTEADYTLDGEKFEVNVLGETYTGTFDGEKLTVDGKEAVMQQ